jgi:glutamate synthase domain-containing protein 2
MLTPEITELLQLSFDIISAILVFFLVVGLLVAGFMFIVDKLQTEHAIRHNYPVIGRFRYFFEELGVFFRQYFFALDREELPFNRAQRSWVYRAAKNVDTTIALGSTRPLNEAGAVIFANCPYPTLSKDAVDPGPITIGAHCAKPFTTKSFFNISGMSYGAISKPAVQALSHGAKKAGCWMNTGEGGLSPYHLEGGCDIVFQIGTAKYGVRNEDGLLDDKKLIEIANISQVKMFELKLSQGAKPGKGGLLPGAKVHAEIASIRGIPEGEDSISPNRHVEVKNNLELLELINHIRQLTGKPVGFKAVLGDKTWIDSLCKDIIEFGIEKAPDFITIDSADGGTGAAPQPLMDYVGLPIRESLPLVVDKLIHYDLRSRVKVIASGKLLTPAWVAWALAVGADFVQCARGFMFALGCIQAMQCNKDTCPTGVTTHNKKLQKGLNPEKKSNRVASYHRNITYNVGMIAHSCGAREPRELTRKHVRLVNEKGVSVPLDEYLN